MPLFRRRRTPDAVRAVAVPAGERRVAWGLTAQGEPVVATTGGLLLPTVGSGTTRLDWADVERAVWDAPELTVRRVALVEGTGPAVRLALAEPGDLPEVVRTRVTASVAWSSHVRLQPQGGVRVVGRRRPGQDALEWQLVFDRGTDPDDPALRQQAERAVLGARRTIG